MLYNFGNGSDSSTPTDLDSVQRDVLRHSGIRRLSLFFKLRVANGCGTVFSLTPSGTEKVLYRFEGNGHGAHDGIYPIGVRVVNGVLYGTTDFGGKYGYRNSVGGTIFSVSVQGKERVLHRFNGTDGTNPEVRLTLMKGALFGATFGGGPGSQCFGSGCGTVFLFSP